MKNLLISLSIVVISAVMTACSSDPCIDEMLEEPATKQTTVQTVENTDTLASRAGNQIEKHAHIRINMYERIAGYSVEISNVKIKNVADSAKVIAFGSNFEGAVLSTKAYSPTFDTANGSFTEAMAGTEIRLVMTFDAKLTAEDGLNDIVRVSGASITLNEESIVLEADGIYDIPVRIEASTLNLKRIHFGAIIRDCNDYSSEN